MILGLDLEGQIGLITEVGLADGSRTLSCQWSVGAKRTTKQAIEDADWVVAHNGLGFDYPALEAEGIKVPPAKQFDTMVAFGLLYPNYLRKLGAALPLLVPAEPWKHLDRVDPQQYNRMDAAVLPPFYKALRDRLEKYGMWDLFINIEQPFWALANRLSRKGLWVGPDSSQINLRYTPKRIGKGATVSPAGEVDSIPHICWPGGQRGAAHEIGPPPGKRLWALRRPDLARLVVEHMAEGDAGPPDPIIDLHLAGKGPLQIQRALGLKPPWTATKALTDTWESKHPWYSRWRDRLAAQVSKDGYIVNPFGRRYWTRDPKGACEFMVQSTVTDIWKALAAYYGPSVYAILPDSLALSDNPHRNPMNIPEPIYSFFIDELDLEMYLDLEEL